VFEDIEVRSRFGTLDIIFFIFHAIQIACDRLLADNVHKRLSMIIPSDGSPCVKSAKCLTNLLSSNRMWHRNRKTHHNLLMKAGAEGAIILLQPRLHNSINKSDNSLLLVRHGATTKLEN
jgi:hypothetical protein